MKKFLKYAGLGMFIMLMTTGCNDDFLERFPLDELTNETFWNSEADLRAFVNKLYPSLGNGIVWTVDDQSDNQAPETFNTVAAGLHTIDNGSWSWSFLRDCNFFLENFDRNPGLDQSVKDRYQGEVLAFRANWVFSRIKRWGDIPFTTRVLTNQDTEELFGERVPRKVVMEQVLEDLTRAAELIPPTAPEGRLTKWAALALKARICLHEGTFRKYHNLGDDQLFLEEAASAAKQIMDEGGFELYSTGDPAQDYNDLFSEISLSGNPEVILARVYDGVNIGHNFIRFMVESIQNGMTKDMVNDYLCTDGLPIGLSPLYQGDNSLPDEFANRDPRMAQTILPLSQNFFAERDGDETEPRLPWAAGFSSATTTGYHIIKYYDPVEVRKIDEAETDLPLIRYAEVLLVYAEAMAELGRADQSVIDLSINRLRERVGMAPMTVADLARDPSSDMVASAGYLDTDVPVLIEEIRRERRVELAAEGFRYDDLMRWRAGRMLTKQTLGVRWDAVKDLTDPSGTPLYSGDSAIPGNLFDLDPGGYIDVYSRQLPGGKVFDPNKHYFFSIPVEEITLNPNLAQNPGWGN